LPQGYLQLKLAIRACLLSRRTQRPGPLLKVRKRPVRRCEQSLRYPVTSGQWERANRQIRGSGAQGAISAWARCAMHRCHHSRSAREAHNHENGFH
jgi:hypothetical protein